MSDIVTITGNIATAPTQVATASGAAITRFRLASSRRRRDATTGEWVDGHTNWYTVCAYRHLGANALASLRKGERIVVTGRLRLRRWEQDGKHGTEAEIDADALGHDLLFGTTAFTRVHREAAEASGAQQAIEATDQGTQADAWAVATAGQPEAEAEPVPF